MSIPRTTVSPASVATFLAALLAAACGADNKPASSPTGATASPAKSGEPSKAEPGKVADKGEGGEKVKTIDGAPPGGDDRYALQIDTPEAKAGQEGSVTVRVVPKAPWHMNLDFPTSLKLQAPDGVTLAKADLKKGDAKLDENACTFDVKFTAPAAGEHAFSGKFKFAVCQDEACSPVTEEVEFKVAVK
jgi:hypothetical protein